METNLIDTLSKDKLISLFSDKFTDIIIKRRSINLIYCSMQFSYSEFSKCRVEFFIKEFKNKFVSSKVTVGNIRDSETRAIFYKILNSYIPDVINSLNFTGTAPKCSN